MDLTFLTDVAKTALGFIAGTVISVVLTGWLFDKFVIKKIVKNKDIQELFRLFRKAEKQLDHILENQENGKK